MALADCWPVVEQIFNCFVPACLVEMAGTVGLDKLVFSALVELVGSTAGFEPLEFAALVEFAELAVFSEFVDYFVRSELVGIY